MEPGFALEEWRELAYLADDLRRTGELASGITRSLRGYIPGAARINRTATTLTRMSQRWEKRAGAARSDAIRDANGDSDWIERHEAAMDEDQALASLARCLKDLQRAAGLLGTDPATAERVRELRSQLDALYAEIYQRDPARGFR